MLRRVLCLALLVVSAAAAPAFAQGNNNVARARVSSAGVEIRRVGTSAWVPIKVESLIGVGDGIRTTEKGRATVSFVDDVITLDLSEASELSVAAYTGDATAFTVQADVQSGFAKFKSLRKLGEAEQFQIGLPAFTATVQQGSGSLRVEASGRSALITDEASQVSIKAQEAESAISASSGARAAKGSALSDVVLAASFPQLDSSLDGCPSSISLTDDVRLNVRLGSSRTFPIIGGLPGTSAVQAMGVAASGGWYRIQFKDGFGWIQVRTLPLDKSCAGLRVFADNFGPEDATLYSDLTDTYDLTVTATPAP